VLAVPDKNLQTDSKGRLIRPTAALGSPRVSESKTDSSGKSDSVAISIDFTSESTGEFTETYNWFLQVCFQPVMPAMLIWHVVV